MVDAAAYTAGIVLITFTLDQVFPPPARPSALLRDFEAWHAANEIAHYAVRPAYLGDFIIEWGADYAAHFALFLQPGAVGAAGLKRGDGGACR